MQTNTIAATTHGRYFVEAASDPTAVVVGFHGYGEDGETSLNALKNIPGAERWALVAVEALHLFYRGRSDLVVGSWMTRVERELAIADNVAYVRSVLERLRDSWPDRPVVLLGFSQGAAMAYRAAAAARGIAAVISLGGDIPPDAAVASLPDVLLGRGTLDTWYSAEKMEADLARLQEAGIAAETCVFDGGHEWSAEFCAAAGDFIQRITQT